MRTKVVDALLAIALLATVASAFSYTWAPVYIPSPHGMLFMSADGRILCSVPSTSGQLTISRDSGQTWSVATNAAPFGSYSGSLVAFSANGSRIFACLSSNGPANALVCRSTNLGTNWTTLTLPIRLSGSYCVACSADGSNVIAGASGGALYFSTNSGANWSAASAPNTNWWSLASSASGQRMIAAAKGGRIYFSTNFGASWTPTNLSAQSWNQVCVSADGQSVGAIGTNSYISRDGGGTWVTNGFSGDGIACSANGSTWLISGNASYSSSTETNVYTSNDGALTWYTNAISGGATCAMSADGCEVTASQLGHITPSPQLNIQTQETNIAISWLLPSTNFVLQQNSDVGSTNWETVSNSVTLNFTDLQQQVTLPASASNAFFRLIAQ